MNKRVEIAKCPVCGATCKVGNDDDWLVHCACCKISFKPEKTYEVDITEYNAKKNNAKETFNYHGWEAFK